MQPEHRSRAAGNGPRLAREPSGSAEPVDLARQIESALDGGRTFEAVDLARHAESSKAAPSAGARRGLRWLAALAYLRGGDTAAARALVDMLETPRRRPVQGADGSLRAQVLEELWLASRRDGDLDRALEARLARVKGGGLADAVAASLLAKVRGRDVLAITLAVTALAKSGKRSSAETPDQLLELARAALVRGDWAAAARTLDGLARQVAARPLERSAVRRALTALGAYGIDVPEGMLEAFPPPRLVIYCGVRDPALADRAKVRAAVQEALDAVGAEIAYGSATAGADLLFAERALARGAELNLVLPCGIEAFRERLVAPAAGDWPQLFDRVIAAATSVTSVTDDRQGLDPLVLEFGNRVIDGTARLRAARLDTRPYLIAACDPLADSGPGGVGDFIDHWGDPARLRLVDLDELLDGEATAGAPSLPPADNGQQIAGLLFADVVGFTRLDDTLLPAFWRFMAAVASHMGDTVEQIPTMRRSWGDAIFVLTEDALSIADYAMALKAAFAAVDARAFGLPDFMAMRIGLHAGPVLAGRHPLTGESMVYGGNVNRAARIEPITLPGRVFASAPFVAWLTAQESAAEAETRLEGGTYRPRYRCTYRGVVELAKRYGPQAVYEVDPWRQETPMPEAQIDGSAFAITLANDVAEHRRLAAAFAAFMAPFGFGDAALAPFEIAFDEVLTNICRYAWTDAGQHAILVEAVVEDAGSDALVSVTIEDDGMPFDPLAIAAPSLDDDIDERAMGGLGIHLVRELMDDMRYVRDGSRNRLTLIKRLEPATAGIDPAATPSVEER